MRLIDWVRGRSAVHCFWRGTALGLTLVLCALPGVGTAQTEADHQARLKTAAAIQMQRELASLSAVFFDDGDWRSALSAGTAGCDGGHAQGCATLGRVLSEPKAGMLDLGRAEAAHRKAAALYATVCNASNAWGGPCAEAAKFLASQAVPAVRDAALARRYYARARDLYARDCESQGRLCLEAAELYAGSLAGQSNEARTVGLLRRGCDRQVSAGDSSGEDGRHLACRNLERLLVHGSPEVRDLAEARRRLTEDGCVLVPKGKNRSSVRDEVACALLGNMLLNGLAGPADLKTGEKLMRFACGQGLQAACAELDKRQLTDNTQNALVLLELGYPDAAKVQLEKRCTANDGRACSEAGLLFQRSNDAKDKERALELHARACTLGNANGCYQQALGLRILGGAANQTSARSLLQKSCGLNDAPSCRVLGFMHGGGEGGAVDTKEAARLYEIACNGRDGIGCQNLGLYYRNGTGVMTDAPRARALHEKACSLGADAGCASFGDALSRGFGGPADPQRGLQVSRQACERNNAQACNTLAALLDDGTAAPADPVAARALFEKACNLRHAAGCVGWSDSLLSSRGGPQNRDGALRVRRFACLILDHQPACTWLTEGGHRDVVSEAYTLASNNRPVSTQVQQQLRSACDAGNAGGCISQGLVLMQSRSGPYSEQMQLFKRACTLGRQDACKLVSEREGKTKP